MRTLLATPLYPPEIGGPATYAKLFEERLPKYGIEVSVLPYSTIRHLPPLVRHIAYALKIIRQARTAEAILVQDTVSTGLPAALASLLVRKPFVVRVPGDYAWEQGVQRFGVKDLLDEFQGKSYGLRVGILRAIQRFVVRRARCVIAPSTYLAGIISRWVPDRKIDVIYNGIELPLPTEVPPNRPVGFLVVSVGRLVSWKGMDGIIRVLAHEKNWHAVIVGNGPEREKLEALAAELLCKNRIQFVGQLPRAQALGWVKVADAFVLNSMYEGLSHQLLEAMALGVPIIARSIGGNPELLEVGELIPKSADDLALCNALRHIESQKVEAGERGRLASQRARGFSIDKTVEATASLLKSCASSQ